MASSLEPSNTQISGKRTHTEPKSAAYVLGACGTTHPRKATYNLKKNVHLRSRHFWKKASGVAWTAGHKRSDPLDASINACVSDCGARIITAVQNFTK